MTNGGLYEALGRAGLDRRRVAAAVGVDPKTVERWLAGRIPYPRHRREVAALVGMAEAELWPGVPGGGNGAPATPAAETASVFAHRGDVPGQLWRRLVGRAQSEIAILAYAGLFLPELHPRLTDVLTERAAAGVRVRILLGEPDSAEVARRGAEEGIGGALAGKVRNALALYRPLVGDEGAEVRLHATTLYTSLYRFDDELLVNTHLYGCPAAHAPVLHLRRTGGGGSFDTYAAAFDRVWASAASATGQDLARCITSHTCASPGSYACFSTAGGGERDRRGAGVSEGA